MSRNWRSCRKPPSCAGFRPTSSRCWPQMVCSPGCARQSRPRLLPSRHHPDMDRMRRPAPRAARPPSPPSRVRTASPGDRAGGGPERHHRGPRIPAADTGHRHDEFRPLALRPDGILTSRPTAHNRRFGAVHLRATVDHPLPTTPISTRSPPRADSPATNHSDRAGLTLVAKRQPPPPV